MKRSEFIKRYVKNKNVLDLGILGDASIGAVPNLHGLIKKHCKNVVGVDIDCDRLLKLDQSDNCEYICDNVVELTKVKEYVNNNEKFDVIVAGELLEHLADPGTFIEKLQDLIHDNGIIVMTVPNTYSLRNITRHILLGNEFPYWSNKKLEIKYGHVASYTPHLINNLIRRKGYNIESIHRVFDDYYGEVQKQFIKNIKHKFEYIISILLPRLSPSIAFAIKIEK